MANPFQKATKEKALLRLALTGPSGSGKTYTALLLAQSLGGKVAVIDTERGSASKYADLFDFDVVELDHFSPREYVTMIKAASQNGYDILIVDSLSHAWSGTGGVLEIVDKETARSKSNNSYLAWAKGTPQHNALVDAILNAPVHIIGTMRSKTEYVLEADKNGKLSPRKVGLAPIQRDGMEYEFDVVGEMDIDNTMLIQKTRCPGLAHGVYPKPGPEVAEILRDWLTDGADPAPRPAPAQPEPPDDQPRPRTPSKPAPAPVDSDAHWSKTLLRANFDRATTSNNIDPASVMLALGGQDEGANLDALLEQYDSAGDAISAVLTWAKERA